MGSRVCLVSPLFIQILFIQVSWLLPRSVGSGTSPWLMVYVVWYFSWQMWISFSMNGGNKVVSTGKKKHQAMLLGGLYFCVHWYSNFLLAKGDWGKEANLKLRGVGRVCYLKSSFSVIMYWSLRWLVEVSYPDLCDFLW